MLHLVTIHAHFVTSNNSFEAVLLAKLLGDVGTKLHAHTSLARSSTGFFLRVRPQHLHHEAGLAGLPLVMPVQLADIIQGDTVVREQATMEDEIFLADEGCQGQGGETF